MSRLRPHTVKASLSNDEKKAVAAIAKRHQMSEAELIRLVLCNADDLDIDFGFSEIVWFLEQNRLVFRESFGFQSKIVWFSENRLVIEPDAKKVKIILNLKMTE